MKFIITENRILNLLEKTLNKVVNSEEYDWVDSIEVEVSSTVDMGWDYARPVYSYVVNFKDSGIPDYQSQSKLFDTISMYHNLIFPNAEDNKPIAYFNTSSKSPDGIVKSFPRFGHSSNLQNY